MWYEALGLAVTILRGEEQNTSEMSALLSFKEEYYSVGSQCVSSCDEAKFLLRRVQLFSFYK